MIGIKVDGRLGNQLFQYVFALAASKKLKTRFFIDQTLINFYPAKYFILPNYFRYTNSFYFWFFQNRLKTKYKVLSERNINLQSIFNLNDKELPLQNNCYYTGYYQSILYFENELNYLKNNIKIKSKFTKIFNNKFNNLNVNTYIAVHVRRTDYLKIDIDGVTNDLSLPKEYFINALSEIRNIKNYHIVFVSDDIRWCKENFSFSTPVHYINGSEIDDFQILMNANKLIISNSTFSWWGAFLNKKSNQFIAPKYWMGYNKNMWLPQAYNAKTLNFENKLTFIHHENK